MMIGKLASSRVYDAERTRLTACRIRFTEEQIIAILRGHKAGAKNPLERILHEIRQSTRVVGAFPDGQSTLNLAAASCVTSPAPHGRPRDI
jgi:hypothetical protein